MATNNSEHTKDCAWHRDWHACDCGVFDECLLVIPNTFIACGEGGNYCSDECMRRANEKNSVR